MVFRPSTMLDLDAAARIAEEGKAFLKKNGVSQWQRGNYPSREVFLSDVEARRGYVVEKNGAVVAVCAVTFTPEASYASIEGNWLTKEDAVYCTVHRSAVSDACKGQGVLGYLLENIGKLALEKGAVSIRIDTHEDNKPMRRALEKAGFVLCGRLILLEGDEVGDPRLGYELPLSNTTQRA